MLLDLVSVARAGETAAASGLLERQAVFLMCGHAAQQPSDVGLVGAALDMLAARLSYPARSSLLAFHMRVLLFDWCSHGYSIQQLLAIQVSTLLSAFMLSNDRLGTIWDPVIISGNNYSMGKAGTWSVLHQGQP